MSAQVGSGCVCTDDDTPCAYCEDRCSRKAGQTTDRALVRVRAWRDARARAYAHVAGSAARRSFDRAMLGYAQAAFDDGTLLQFFRLTAMTDAEFDALCARCG